MSFESIAARLTGYVTRLPKSEAYNLTNDAWQDVRDDRLWSFQLAEDGVSTPNVISVGTFTVVLGSNQVTADAQATTALTGLINPFITQRQFRVQGFSTYSIIAAAGSPLVLTLDRVYTDPSGTGLPYQVYQAYYPAPVADFKRWLDWRDMVNGEWLSIYTTRREVNMGDPQRLYYTFPHWVIPYAVDTRGIGTVNASATLGLMLYELYPNPLQQISYMRYWVRMGADLVNPGDTLPYPISDNLVLARAKELAYLWQESQRDPSVPRGQTADYKFLSQAASKEYQTELKQVGLKDRDLIDLFISRIPKPLPIVKQAYYSTLLNRAYSG